MTDSQPHRIQVGDRQFSASIVGQGPVVLCLHGFPDSLYTFDDLLPVLVKRGFKAVSVALPGYEPSSQVQSHKYRTDQLVSDVIAVIDALEVQQVHLIGHDWGAAIAYNAASQYPARFKSLITLSVPHSGLFTRDALLIAKQRRLSWYMFFFQLPWLAERKIRANDFEFLEQLWRDWSPGWRPPEHVIEQMKQTFSQPGVVEAALQYYRSALSIKSLSPKTRKALDFEVAVPTLAMTGDLDGCIDADVFEQLSKAENFPNGLSVVRVQNAGHFLHLEQPQRVHQEILAWITARSE